ncbi:MAG: CBS domain-containing protein [Candidatus Helarchaeota archaeon]
MKISEIMNVDFKKFSIDKDRILTDALNLMDKIKTSILLCIDKKKELKGIITEREILDRLGSKKIGNIKTSSIRVSSVMIFNPIVVKPDDTIYYAARVMDENGYTGVPVMNQGLEGFVSHNEILKVCEKVSTITVEHIMDDHPIIISDDDRIIHARRIMFEKNVSYLLVGSKNSINGILTEGMLARSFADFRETTTDMHQEERIRAITVEECIRNPVFISKETTIGDAAKIMLEKGVRLLVILNDSGRLLGIVSKDILTKFVKDGLTLKNYK